MVITQNRFKYYSKTTISKVYVDGIFFCYALEDTVRAQGIKVKNYTAIAENLEGYKVAKHMSNRFKRYVAILYTEDDKITLKYGGISFTYVYTHGGNDAADTDGCVLVAYNWANNTIYKAADKELTKKIFTALDNGEEVKWIIKNLPQTE